MDTLFIFPPKKMDDIFCVWLRYAQTGANDIIIPWQAWMKGVEKGGMGDRWNIVSREFLQTVVMACVYLYSGGK